MKKGSSRVKWVVVAFGLFACAGIVLNATTKKKIGEPIETEYGVHDPAFRNSISYLIGPALTESNSVTPLVNGKEFFPAMLEAIDSAKRSITFETYIWESGNIGGKFVEALSRKASEGVKVNVIVDGMGTLKFKDEDQEKMKAAGVHFVKFARDKWYKIKPDLNHRTHRKLLIIDGKVGFTGGACIGDKWDSDAPSTEFWRDNHYKIEGPVVGQMQGVFAENWLQTTGEVLEGPDYFPLVERKGNLLVQCFKSGPKEGAEGARLVHLYAIAAARKNIRLEHAYFVPDELSVEMLLQARKRGVEIEIIIPGETDSKIGKAAARSRWEDLAREGVKFYEYKKALLHAKLMIVDDMFVSAGSVNFDNRSFSLNDEANFNVLDEKFAREHVKIFEQDKADSEALTFQELNGRPKLQKFADACAGLLRSQL